VELQVGLGGWDKPIGPEVKNSPVKGVTPIYYYNKRLI